MVDPLFLTDTWRILAHLVDGPDIIILLIILGYER